MGNERIGRNVIQIGSLFLIADGVMGLLGSVMPRWHSLVWHVGPQLAKAVTEELEAHRKTARGVYLAEATIGIALLLTDDE